MECQSALFSLPADMHYLNCAAYGPLPRATEAAGLEGVRRKSVPVDVGPQLLIPMAEALRAEIAALVNAPVDRVALIPSVSYGMGIAARNLPLGAGDEAVLVGDEFPSNVLAWVESAAAQGGTVRLVPRPDVPPGGVSREWNARLLEAITPATRLAAVTPLHWMDGVPFDMMAVRQRTREVGALMVLDGSQSIGAQPLDWQAVQPDLLLCAGYKWLLGPYKCCFAVVGDALLGWQPLEYTWLGREGHQNQGNFTNYHARMQSNARRFDVGERANWINLPMLTESIRQLRTWGVDAVEQYCQGLTATLHEALAEEPARGFALPAAADHAPHLLGISLGGGKHGGLDPHKVAGALAERNIIVSVRGSSVRVSPNVYNTDEDMHALLSALREICR